jgi:hypothetical protein
MNARRSLGILVLTSLWLTTWALSHPYRGIFHDAQLYTLQALRHLEPALSNDVFLRFGSQDRYTIFSFPYAAAIRLLGVDHAAAILTLGMQVALFLALALLGRQVMSIRSTLLGVSLLLAIPGAYGANNVFACVESFVTPRMAAEALILCSMGATLRGRAGLGVALVIPAMLIHPAMGAVGIPILFFIRVGIPRPLPGIALLALSLMIVLALAATISGQLDDPWLQLLEQRSPYLMLAGWSLEDWSKAVVLLGTLAIGVRVLPTEGTAARARTLCLATLLTTVVGLMLTLLGCDLLHLVLLTQAQPWRWQWLAVAVAALLLPLITRTSWDRGAPDRIAGLLLVSAWIFASGPPALLATSAALLATLIPRHWLCDSRARLLFFGACGLLGIALVLRISSNLLFMEAYYADPQAPLWVRQMASFAQDGTVPFALTLLVLTLTLRPRGVPGLVLIGALSVVACAALTPITWRLWSKQQFPPSLVAEFASWRAAIPPGKDVFWSESPLQVWVLLERPSYLSVVQSSGLVFSRAAAMEIRRRAQALSEVATPASFLSLAGNGAGLGPTPEQLRRACEAHEFEFLVTATTLEWTPLATLPKEVWHSSGGLRLYRCTTPNGA